MKALVQYELPLHTSSGKKGVSEREKERESRGVTVFVALWGFFNFVFPFFSFSLFMKKEMLGF